MRGVAASYIADIRASPAIWAKVAEKHNVTEPEVREAFILTSLVRAGWDLDPERGWRLLGTGTTYQGRRLNAVPYPVDADDGIWRLGTAFWAE